MRVQIVSFRCVLKNKLGHFISSSFNRDVATTTEVPVESQALPGFVDALKGLKEGEKKRISVSAENAYGFYEPRLCVEVPRSDLKNGKSLKVDDLVKGSLTGDGIIRSFRVVHADRIFVLLDANHPLAGQDLEFDVEVTASHEEVNEPEFELIPAGPKRLLC